MRFIPAVSPVRIQLPLPFPCRAPWPDKVYARQALRRRTAAPLSGPRDLPAEVRCFSVRGVRSVSSSDAAVSCAVHRGDFCGPLVKRSRHRPFTAESRVRFSHGSPNKNSGAIVLLLLQDKMSSLCGGLADGVLFCRPGALRLFIYNLHGPLVKRLRRRPLTAESGVRFSHGSP